MLTKDEIAHLKLRLKHTDGEVTITAHELKELVKAYIDLYDVNDFSVQELFNITLGTPCEFSIKTEDLRFQIFKTNAPMSGFVTIRDGCTCDDASFGRYDAMKDKELTFVYTGFVPPGFESIRGGNFTFCIMEE